MKYKRRVYMFVYLFPPEFTGASLQAINLAKWMRKKGIEVTFITATPEPRKKYNNIHDGFKVIRLTPPANNSNFSILIFWLQLLFLLIWHYKRYYIIHTIGIGTQLNILALYGKILRKKTLVKTTLSNEVDNLNRSGKQGLEKKFSLFALKKYDKIIGISKKIVSSLINSGFRGNQVVYIPNGVDLTKFKPPRNREAKSRIKKRLGLPTQGVLFSYVGVIHRRKKIDWLIKHWLKVFKNNDDCFLLIAGPLARETIMADGGGKDYFNYLIQLTNKLGGSNKIFFKPFKQEVEDYFKISDYFINPSESEGLSNSLLEAMACGAIPIVSRSSGSEDVVINGYNGYIFNIGDNKDLASTLSLCMKERSETRKLSRNAQKTIKDYFSISITCSGYVQLYRNLV